nr:TolC family protein [Acetoanaerobium pronyense]
MAQSKQIRFQKDQVEVQKMVTLENIKLQILSAFNNIDKAINEKEILILKISRMREKLNLEKIKNNLGVSSQFDLITMQNELSNSEKNLEKLNKSIESYYLELEKVLNTKVDRPIESNKVSFEKLNESETDVTKQESLALSNNILVWGKEQEIDFKEFELELFILTLPPINTGESISSEPYNIKKIDQSLLSNELSTLRNDVRESVRTKYDNIKTLEKNREILINSIRILEEEIKMMKVRESAGLITQEPIKDMNLQLVELKNTLEEIERQHGFLIYVYSNPVLSGM